jgi:hypothetical protein
VRSGANNDAVPEDEMPDFLQWSAVLLALLGLFLWCWSAGIPVPQTPDASVQSVVRRKRQIGRVALFAAMISALLQAAGAAPSRTQLDGIELWASVMPPAGISANLPI